MVRARVIAVLLSSLAACDAGGSSGGAGGAGGAGGDGGASTGGAGGAGGATGGFGGAGGGIPVSGLAPDGAFPGEAPASDGAQPVSVDAGGEVVLRVDAAPTEHIGFFLTFDPGPDGVELELYRWDGAAPEALAVTDGGVGLRTLAAFDGGGPRTFWVRITATDALGASLEVVRTPFADGASCPGDCERLLQLPVRNDPATDGYDWTASTVFRYQFGRRDLVMLLRHAAREMALSGRAPIIPEDLSQWDAETPGTDVGAPRHASHQNGKDVDISLYGTDGLSIWRSYCEVVVTADGRECVPGTESGLDGRANAEMYAAFLQSGRVTMSFLDQELIPVVAAGAEEAAAADALDAALVPLFSDGVHLMHWPNHDNHIHVRLSTEPY